MTGFVHKGRTVQEIRGKRHSYLNLHFLQLSDILVSSQFVMYNEESLIWRYDYAAAMLKFDSVLQVIMDEVQ
jgi:hypothetical protein